MAMNLTRAKLDEALVDDLSGTVAPCKAGSG